MKLDVGTNKWVSDGKQHTQHNTKLCYLYAHYPYIESSSLEMLPLTPEHSNVGEHGGRITGIVNCERVPPHINYVAHYSAVRKHVKLRK